MSLPSDVTPDISEGDAAPSRRIRKRGERFSAEQQGLVFAALVAFLGVTYLGPAFRRAVRRPPLVDRAKIRLDDTRRRVRKARSRAKQRMRRLGGS